MMPFVDVKRGALELLRIERRLEDPRGGVAMKEVTVARSIERQYPPSLGVEGWERVRVDEKVKQALYLCIVRVNASVAG